MEKKSFKFVSILLRLLAPLGVAILMEFVLFSQLRNVSMHVNAAPIEPPQGYPRFIASAKVVSPTLAKEGGAKLDYVIEVRNTGAYTAENVSVVDVLPTSVAYTGEAKASAGGQPVFITSTNTLTWTGTVGFDQTVLISYSVDVTSTFSGPLENAAVIQHVSLSEPVTVTALAMITDDPILTITKSSAPDRPGPNKQLTYTLTVMNEGQPAVGLPITVTDRLPLSTTLGSIGEDGSAGPAGTVTFEREVDLDTGASSVFTFSVNIQDVTSGTVITNDDYHVDYLDGKLGVGEPYTTTVVDPILLIAKHINPDPPGSNEQMTYTITVANLGSIATNMVITDVLPAGFSYVPLSGGSYNPVTGVISWMIPHLDTDELVNVSYAVIVGDVAQVPIVNAVYGVCSSEGACTPGKVLTSTVFGPSFVVTGWVDPLAKKPGGGNVVVTPTLVVENKGPGSAIHANAILTFDRITVSNIDVLKTIPASQGTFYTGSYCGDNCREYLWIGDIAAFKTITFTTDGGQSTIGGEELIPYTATLVITDQLGSYVTEPFTGSGVGHVTHRSSLIPTKTGPSVIGAGEELTYTIEVFNNGLTTLVPPYPVLTETIPLSTTFVRASNGGLTDTVDGRTTISWTLPSMNPGDSFLRSFTVLVPDDLVTGTQILNDQYGTLWKDKNVTGLSSATGVSVTTTVKEVGLIDSYKEVEPQIVTPGADNILTYTIHVVNSGAHNLIGVQVYDWLPWQSSTYQRDAVAQTGVITDDIISVLWKGDVGPFSEKTITLTVLVDPGFTGAITNTAVITHASLRAPVVLNTASFVSEKPVLLIQKTASPDPVYTGDPLVYTIKVSNLGQMATQLVITDVLPTNVEYIPGSVSAGGVEMAGDLRWEVMLLKPGESVSVSYRVTVGNGLSVINDLYGVLCYEGVTAFGKPVVTTIQNGKILLFLPILHR